MMENQAAKPKQPKVRKFMLVRYGRMNAIGFFEHNEANIPKVPTRVVVKTEKGLELGDIVGRLCSYKTGQYKLDKEQVKKYFEDSQIDISCNLVGSVIRLATADDISEEKHLQKNAKEEMEYCRKLVKEMQLPMEIVDADHIFGGERIVFYFMSDGRIDFRELVKRIAQEYQTRIEMRQIGSRDEAKLFGDYETCGQECCCKKFLKALKPVNMRMAKMQKATLDPSKISGYCGRLKCCLRYEDETYTELKRRLPRKGTRVKTSQGMGKIVDGQILTQVVMVEHDDQTKGAFPLSEIEILSDGQNFPQQQENAEEPREDIPAEDEHRKYEHEQDDSRQEDTDDESYDQQDTQQTDPDQQFNP